MRKASHIETVWMLRLLRISLQKEKLKTKQENWVHWFSKMLYGFQKCLNSLAPLRKPSFEFSKAALVISLKAEVRAPATPRPAMNDYKEARRLYL